MKKRIVGTVVVVAVALGVYLSQWFRGLGVGVSNEDGAAESVQVSTESGSGDIFGDSGEGQPRQDVAEPEGGVLTVVIEDDGYRIAPPEDLKSGIDVELDDIMRQLPQASGNDDGIRIRLLMHKSAQMGAKSDLYTALDAAGVQRESIQEISGFIE